MPGIVGLFTKMPREWAEPQLQKMAAAIRHESFYTNGSCIDESLGIYVSWVAHKNSFCDDMPVRNEHGDVVMVFSGEEFPEPGVRADLERRGHTLAAGVASYLPHLYEDDSRFPVGLNGRFHGLVMNRRIGTATLFDDRYGMHRLYYHQSKEAFYFAAEAKAILAVRPELRQTDPRGLGELITCGCVLENRSVFQGVHVLPPASAWVFRNGGIEKRHQYFQPSEWAEQTPLDAETYYRELREVFSRNLPRYFVTSQPIGISLTGGLDTRMILAWWKGSRGSLPCYTFRGTYNDSQDVVVARKVAKLCDQPFTEISVGKDFLSRFDRYAERTVYLTDGCADVGRAPVLYSNERAAEIAPVRMTGNYGSEVLRRMIAFKPGEPTTGLFNGELQRQFLEAKHTYARLLDCHPVSFIAFQQVPWFHWGLLALEQTQLSPRSPYLDNDLVRTAYRVPDASLVKGAILADNDDCLRLIGDGNPALRGLRTDRGLGVPRTLRGALTRAFLEVTFKAEYEFDYGMPQWAAQVDRLLAGLHFERLFLGRHKYYHFRVWYRDALSSYVREMLLDPRTLSRPYLNRKRVESMVQGHLKGNRNYTLEIHKVLSLELLHRLFVDSQSAQ
jgi:asparagine synthase (glutamine-hydrolysing)